MSPKSLLALLLGLVLLTTAIAEELDHRHHPFKEERHPKGHKPPYKHHPGGGRLLLWSLPIRPFFPKPKPPKVRRPPSLPDAVRRPEPHPGHPFPKKPPHPHEPPTEN
ncbi:early nodulin-75-like [Rhodamnia argentea]|uniref:Early nodulin-75-like n=1 Tax=Rhodamnia argentea TaxID=178133 RepID=A0ABM3H9Z4_9MYRT|nr:early nodulin-75-like [Rhodamnia argentea]